MLDLQQALDAAKEAAVIAGTFLKEKHEELVRSGDESALHIEAKKPNDYVTDVDKTSQQMIIEHIHAAFPEHRFIGEEMGSDAWGNPGSPYAWIIDPLDGTHNFIRKQPNFGCLIALQYNGELVLGIVYQPIGDTMWSGAKGMGVHLNGEKIAPLRPTKNMADAVVCMNFSHQTIKKDDETWVKVPQDVYIKNYGNAVEEIAHVLLGWNDGVAFNGIGLWDAAAGAFLIQEAGGKSRLELINQDNVYDGIKCVACTAPIFDELEEFVFTS